MKKAQVLEKLDQTWAEFQGSFAGLSESQMAQPGVTGEWSVKDILAHVTAWEEESTQAPAADRPGRQTAAL